MPLLQSTARVLLEVSQVLFYTPFEAASQLVFLRVAYLPCLSPMKFFQFMESPHHKTNEQESQVLGTHME